MTLKHFRFSTILSISPFFSLNFVDKAEDPIIRKIILFEQILNPPRTFELHEFMRYIFEMQYLG